MYPYPDLFCSYSLPSVLSFTMQTHPRYDGGKQRKAPENNLSKAVLTATLTELINMSSIESSLPARLKIMRITPMTIGYSNPLISISLAYPVPSRIASQTAKKLGMTTVVLQQALVPILGHFVDPSASVPVRPRRIPCLRASTAWNNSSNKWCGLSLRVWPKFPCDAPIGGLPSSKGS